MSIWLKCINNRITRRKIFRPSFLDSSNVLSYKTTSLYLGKEGYIYLKSCTLEIYIHYSERDGLEWRSKSKNPYKILFEYNDGSYYINDSMESKYTVLIQALDLLSSRAHNQHYRQTYEQLERITSDWLDKFAQQ